MVNQCISEQIPKQKRHVLGADQLIEGSSNTELKDTVFVKSSTGYEKEMSKKVISRRWADEPDMPNFDTGRIRTLELSSNKVNIGYYYDCFFLC